MQVIPSAGCTNELIESPETAKVMFPCHANLFQDEPDGANVCLSVDGANV